MSSDEARAQKWRAIAHDLQLSETSRGEYDTSSIRIENCIGFSKVPVGLAGPVHISGAGVDSKLYAPLATYEPTLVASCSRGCKAFDAAGGLKFEVFGEAMSRSPVFVFADPGEASTFCRAVPNIRDDFAEWAESTSRFVRLQELRGAVIGSHVQLLCSYACGDASGQNMVTKATAHACEILRGLYGNEFRIKDFFIDGNLSSDKIPSWGNTHSPRGVSALAWGVLTPAVCRDVLGCDVERLYQLQQIGKDGGIRAGHFGSNMNTANILAAMFIAAGQDPGSVAEASWSHLTSELDRDTGNLTMSIYFPSMPVGTVGGGTGYSTQAEALRMLGCEGPGRKHALAGIIASFSLALEVSTSAAVTNDTFASSHIRLARGADGKLQSKI